MKKICLSLLLALLTLTLFPVFSGAKVQAENMACGLQYEVDHINDDGSFSKIACYSDFSDAQKKMTEDFDSVVRHKNSYSPSKIIAMNQGLAYSYPYRSGTNTMNLYSKVPLKNEHYKTTYVSSHYEMTYLATERYFPTGNYQGGGIIQVILNGFEGYTDLEYTDLVPDKFIRNSIPITLGGGDITGNGESPFKVICNYSYYSVKENGKYNDLVFTYYRAYSNKADHKPYSASISVGPAPEFMEKGKKYYSADGHDYYLDSGLKEYAGTNYNYYQYLPLRSHSNVTSQQLDDFLVNIKGLGTNSVIKGQGGVFVSAQNTYGANALLIYAMACHESAYGTSSYARNRYNLFGYAAYDASPSSASSYGSVQQCVEEHMGYNLRFYMDVESGKYFSSSLGNKGSGFNVNYASDPYWSLGISAIAYQIDKFINGNNGKLSEYGHYDLALVQNYDVPVYAKADAKSKVLYNTSYGDDYQKDLIVLVHKEVKDFYQVASSNPIDENGNMIAKNSNPAKGLVPYDFNRSVVYLSKKDVVFLKDLDNENDNSGDHEPMVSIRKLQMDEDGLNISGISILVGKDSKDISDLHYELDLCDFTGKVISTYEAEVLDGEGFSLNDGHDYHYGAYSLCIPMKDIAEGSYLFRFRINNDGEEKVYELSSTNEAFAYLLQQNDELSYLIQTNELYNYRLELDVSVDPLDHSRVHKPTSRASFSSFDSISLKKGVLKVDAHAFIYYLDYGADADVSYDLYLVNGDQVYTAETVNVPSPLDYQTFLDSSRSLDQICFSSSLKLKDIPSGEYVIMIGMHNGEHYDIVELSNRSHRKINGFENEKRSYQILDDTVRDRMVLKVEDK